MTAKITLAICVVVLLCMTTSTECNQFRNALKPMGKVMEKIDQKALDDGLVSAYLGSKIAKRSVDSVDENSRRTEEELWHNEPAILLNRPEADEYLDRKILPAPY